MELENLSIPKKYDKKILENEKFQEIKKSGFMELYQPEKIDTLGGLQIGKEYNIFYKKLLNSQSGCLVKSAAFRPCLTAGFAFHPKLNR